MILRADKEKGRGVQFEERRRKMIFSSSPDKSVLCSGAIFKQ